jgi:hypothetical protein
MIRLFFSVVVLVCAFLPACNVLGPAAVLIDGPQKVPAQFTLPKDRPTMIFIDDRANRLGRKNLRNIVAESAQALLVKEELVKEVIDYRAGVALSEREAAFQPMDLVTLGKTAEAEVIIFATIDSFTLTPDGQTFRPSAVVRVKVLDVNKPAPRIWPEAAEGYATTIQFNQRATPLPKRSADLVKAQNAFAVKVGEGITNLFFDALAKESVGQR